MSEPKASECLDGVCITGVGDTILVHAREAIAVLGTRS